MSEISKIRTVGFTSIFLGVLSTAVGAASSEPTKAVDKAFDLATVRCEKLGYTRDSAEYRDCVDAQLLLIGSTNANVTEPRTDVDPKPSACATAFIGNKPTFNDESQKNICVDPVRPLPPCPQNPRVIWSDCVGDFNFTRDSSFGRSRFFTDSLLNEVYKPSNDMAGGSKPLHDYPSSVKNPMWFFRSVRGRYSGEWKLNNPHWQGVLVSPNGERYEGAFFLGRLHGRGTLTFADGAVYVGDFFMNERTGTATQTYKSGDKYTGTFNRGQRHGTGLLMYADGRVYHGEFRDDQLHGIGKLALTNGDYYEGQFSANSITGDGTLTFSDGRRYVGGWKDNLRDGKGVLYSADGTVVLEGRWRRGEYVGVVGK
jgi:hypothetical protein